MAEADRNTYNHVSPRDFPHILLPEDVSFTVR